MVALWEADKIGFWQTICPAKAEGGDAPVASIPQKGELCLAKSG